MDSPGYIILSRLALQARSTQVLANNIANADTPGFRNAQPIFAEYVSRQRDVPSAQGPRVSYAQDRATWRETRSGSLQTTGNPLDVAMTGDGYFAVETLRGERYTRAGRFAVGADGRLVDAEGNAVLGTGGAAIAIAAGDTRIEIMGDGTVRSENGTLGQLRVVRFENSQRLRAEGSRLYDAGGEEPRPVDRPAMAQGAFEGSNVSPILEMTRLTAELREFQLSVQFTEREGERMQTAVERILRRRGQ